MGKKSCKIIIKNIKSISRNNINLYSSEDRYISFIFYFAIFFPVFYSIIGSTGAILINGSIIILTTIHLSINSNYLIKINCKNEKYYVVAILLTFLFYLFNISLATSFSESIIFSDLYELHRPVLYTLIFFSSLAYFDIPKRLENLHRLLNISFVVVIILGVLHFTGLFDSIPELYTKSHNVNTRRVSTPFINPYDYSFFMVLMFNIYISMYFFSKRASHRLLYGAGVIVSTMGVILTQSRTGFILLILSVVLITFFLTYKSFDRIKKLKINKVLFKVLLTVVVLSAFVIYIFSIYWEQFYYLFIALTRLFGDFQIASTGQDRIDLMNLAIEEAKKSNFSLLFGNGPSKAVLENPEAGYAYFLYRYGITSLIIFFFTPLILICGLLLKIIKKIHHNNAIHLGILTWMLTIPVAYLATNFTEQVRLSFIYYFLFGFVIRSYFHKQNKVFN